MKISYKTVVAVTSSIISSLTGMQLLFYLRADKCLDLGGRVASWGGCAFGEGRADIISISTPSLILGVACSMVVFIAVSYLLRAVLKNI